MAAADTTPRAITRLLQSVDSCDCDDGRCFFTAVRTFLHDRKVYDKKRKLERTQRVPPVFKKRMPTIGKRMSVDDVSVFAALNPLVPPIMVLGFLPLELATPDNIFFPLLLPANIRCDQFYEGERSSSSLITLVYDNGHFTLVNSTYRLFLKPPVNSSRGTYTCWRHARAFFGLQSFYAHASCCHLEPMAIVHVPTRVDAFLETHFPFWAHADVRLLAVTGAELLSIAAQQWPDWLALEARRAGDGYELRALVKLRPWDPAFAPCLDEQWARLVATTHSDAVAELDAVDTPQFVSLRVIGCCPLASPAPPALPAPPAVRLLVNNDKTPRVIHRLLNVLNRCGPACSDGRCFFESVAKYMTKYHMTRKNNYVLQGPRDRMTLDGVSAYVALNPFLSPFMVLGILPLELASADNIFFPLLASADIQCEVVATGMRSSTTPLVTFVFDRGHFTLIRNAYRLFREKDSASTSNTFTCWRHARAFPALGAYRTHAARCPHEPAAFSHTPARVASFIETHYAFWAHADARVCAASAASLVAAAEQAWPDWLVLEARHVADAYELRALVKLRPWDASFKPQLDEYWAQLTALSAAEPPAHVITALDVCLTDTFVTLRAVTEALTVAWLFDESLPVCMFD